MAGASAQRTNPQKDTPPKNSNGRSGLESRKSTNASLTDEQSQHQHTHSQVSTANNYGSDAAIRRDTEVVFSDDPETGLAGPREVLATWPNTDSLAEFGVGGRAGTCSLLRPDPQTLGVPYEAKELEQLHTRLLSVPSEPTFDDSVIKRIKADVRAGVPISASEELFLRRFGFVSVIAELDARRDFS